MDLQKEIDKLQAIVQDDKLTIKELRMELHKALTVITSHGQHKRHCIWNEGGISRTCNCGYTEVIKELRPKLLEASADD